MQSLWLPNHARSVQRYERALRRLRPARICEITGWLKPWYARASDGLVTALVGRGLWGEGTFYELQVAPCCVTHCRSGPSPCPHLQPLQLLIAWPLLFSGSRPNSLEVVQEADGERVPLFAQQGHMPWPHCARPERPLPSVYRCRASYCTWCVAFGELSMSSFSSSFTICGPLSARAVVRDGNARENWR